MDEIKLPDIPDIPEVTFPIEMMATTPKEKLPIAINRIVRSLERISDVIISELEAIKHYGKCVQIFIDEIEEIKNPGKEN